MKKSRRRKNPLSPEMGSTLVFAAVGAAAAFGLYEWWKSSQTPPALTPAQVQNAAQQQQLSQQMQLLAADISAAQGVGNQALVSALQITMTQLIAQQAALSKAA